MKRGGPAHALPASPLPAGWIPSPSDTKPEQNRPTSAIFRLLHQGKEAPPFRKPPKKGPITGKLLQERAEFRMEIQKRARGNEFPRALFGVSSIAHKPTGEARRFHGVCLRKKRWDAAPAAVIGKKETERVQMHPLLLVLYERLSPSPWRRSPRRSSPASSQCPRPSRSGWRP